MPTIHWKQNQIVIGLCVVLGLGTLALYWPVVHHPFITLDDNLYVTDRPQVQAGITGAGVAWAFTDTTASNWHPLTWLSHMLDCEWYGLKAGGHHLTNVFFHIANTLLLFVWLRGATGAVWRSAVVAALFAWHPLHVESVAWVAERKDVLSAFFWLLTLLAYTQYARGRPREAGRVTASAFARLTPRAAGFYGLALLLFACGLMAKPMVVTLPFVLLLVDIWPLQRCQVSAFSLPVFLRLVWEKIPFLVLAVAESLISIGSQKGGGATWSSDLLPLSARLANALVSYCRYISKTFWPADLAIIYPYQEHWPLMLVLAAGLFLLVCSGLAVLRVRQNPFLFFGWFYFVGTLIPVIGLVQVGPQAMADRYVYLPSIGLFVLVVWGAHELLAARAQWQKMAVLAAAGACCVVTVHQLKYWESSVKLLAHTVEVTPENYAATTYLGSALALEGRNDEALPFYIESVRITPAFPIAQWNLGLALLNRGRAVEACEHLAVAAKLTPNDAVIHGYYGKALYLAGNSGLAQAQLVEALRLKPEFAEAHFFLGVVLATQNKTAEALPHFAEAVRLEPTNPELRFNYGLALLDDHQSAEAVAQFNVELRLTPNEAKAHYRLALALQQQDQPAAAFAHLQQALKLTPDFLEAKKDLDALLITHPGMK